MLGILLAGGTGTRLHPLTRAVSKQLMPVYDKPMVYYPLATLMMAGVRETVVITTPHDAPAFERLLGDGTHLGMRLHYAVQPRPEGLAQALLIAEPFTRGHKTALALGDNIFHGTGLGTALRAHTDVTGAHVFAHHVADPHRYGVVEFDPDGRVLSLQEKPAEPRSNYAVPGLYFYDETAPDVARTLTPGPRGELEITDLNNHYLAEGTLTVSVLERGTAWLDTGTVQSMMDAAQYVQVVEARQGHKIGCVEEIAWRNGWITDTRLHHLATELTGTQYGAYLHRLLAEGPGAPTAPGTQQPGAQQRGTADAPAAPVGAAVGAGTGGDAGAATGARVAVPVPRAEPAPR